MSLQLSKKNKEKSNGKICRKSVLIKTSADLYWHPLGDGEEIGVNWRCQKMSTV